MTDPVKLRKLYQITTTEFPKLNHSQDVFLKAIYDVLDDDPIRNSGLRGNLESEGLDFVLIPDFPKNDFSMAAAVYLLNLGLDRDKANNFENSLSERSWSI